MTKTRIYASVIVRNAKGSLLILQRTDDAIFAPGQWEFVNGTIESDETAEETALREVFEETGIKLKLEQLLPTCVHELVDADGRWVVIPFRADSSGDVHISDEHQAYKWVSEDEIFTVPYVGDDYQILVDIEKRKC